ncbi:transposase [Rhizobium leguminosarum]
MHCENETEDEADSPSGKPQSKPRATNRGSLPAHLPRVEEIIEPESLICDCGGGLHCIGEDVSERLDVIPVQFRVIVTRRPKYACRACTDGVAQAPAPARLIQAGLPTEATIAHVLVSKYADHLPLYRQAQIMSRQGIDLEALAYIAKYWDGLCVFLTDGRIEIDNDAVERTIRPIALKARTLCLRHWCNHGRYRSAQYR